MLFRSFFLKKVSADVGTLTKIIHRGGMICPLGSMINSELNFIGDKTSLVEKRNWLEEPLINKIRICFDKSTQVPMT